MEVVTFSKTPSQKPLSPSRPKRAIKRIRDLELAGRRLFLRLDFNVPLGEKNAEGIRVIRDDSRIREAIPTIQYAIEAGAKVVLASHLGRPKGQRNEDFSLLPVALHLADLLNTEVTLADECVGEGIELMVQNMKRGEVLLLENLRFHPGEEKNDTEFAFQLSKLTDVYVTDAFGTAHRKHASTYGLPLLVSQKGMGFLMEKEIEFLDQLIHQPERPFYTVLGGAKVSDKIQTVQSLLKEIDALFVGGAMAYAFFAAQGKPIPEGGKKPSEEDIRAAKVIIQRADSKEIPIYLPVDTIDSFDVGPKTLALFQEKLKDAKTLFWNGPLGWFEKKEYAQGTLELAQFLAPLSALKVVGGGDTVSAVKQSGVSEQFSHLSTGGGAALEYLQSGKLPGVEILKFDTKRPLVPYLEPEDDEGET